ncbi:YgjV family protein [Anaeromyxobacter diazotrophicus]|uniref:Permease n=1 Tax=Anaeromyxobacter diazotrophicus TaxID=2590199 RepID=A0A7I9VMW8_9BACT|nr:YgjV family protein [Anaeromyxobacter diazotrophicus]GEJ57744.1 permease [Anaeromyxobacter diazotrophicus]
MHPFSPAQVVGYVALALGVTGFLQRDDGRLKFFVALESFVYVLHFALLGRPPAASSAAVSGVRTLLSRWFRSAWLAAASVAVNLALAVALATHGAGWLPVAASCLGAVAVFTLEGIPMRVALLGSTSLWLANNVLSRSIGGTVLESLIAVASLSTIARMAFAQRAAEREAVRPATRAAT